MSAKTLRQRMEDLPRAPVWKMQEISLNGYETVKPITLFYRDPLECIQVLLQNPTFEGRWAFTARRVYRDPSCENRVYSEWMTGDGAWSAQVSISLASLVNSKLTSFISPPSHQAERSSA